MCLIKPITIDINDVTNKIRKVNYCLSIYNKNNLKHQIKDYHRPKKCANHGLVFD